MEILFLEDFPIILTKDRTWPRNQVTLILREGSIILLPEDAVLVRYKKLVVDDTPQN